MCEREGKKVKLGWRVSQRDFKLGFIGGMKNPLRHAARATSPSEEGEAESGVLHLIVSVTGSFVVIDYADGLQV